MRGSQSPRLLRGRHFEKGAREALKKPVKPLASLLDFEAKKKAEQEELEKVKLGDLELSNVLHFKYLGVMQSSDGDSLVAFNHRIAIPGPGILTSNVF